MHAELESAGYDWMHANFIDLVCILDAFGTDLGAPSGVTLLTISELGRQV